MRVREELVKEEIRELLEGFTAEGPLKSPARS